MHPFITIGPLSLPSYGICMAAGIAAAFLVSWLNIRKQGESFDSLLMLGASALAGGLCLTKIFYYIFTYGIGRLFREMFSGNFSGLSDSGMIFYGGLIGGAFAALIVVRLNHYDFDTYANAIVPSIPLGHAFGRLGCLLAGCCYGMAYNGPFAVHSAFADPNESLFPVQACEAILNLFLFVILSVYAKRNRNGMITLVLYLMLYAAVRFVLEFFRGDPTRSKYLGINASQWISLAVFLSGPILLLFKVKKQKGKEISLSTGNADHA